VEVQQHFEAEGLGLLRGGDGVVEVVGQPRGRVEQTEADPVVAVVFEDLQAEFGLAFVFELDALLLRLGEKGDVCADGLVEG
jgi:hypothetical protein